MKNVYLVTILMIVTLLSGCYTNVIISAPISHCTIYTYMNIDGYVYLNDHNNSVVISRFEKDNDKGYVPLVKAKITIKQTNKSIKTNNDGYFSFSKIPKNSTMVIEHKNLPSKLYIDITAF